VLNTTTLSGTTLKFGVAGLTTCSKTDTFNGPYSWTSVTVTKKYTRSHTGFYAVLFSSHIATIIIHQQKLRSQELVKEQGNIWELGCIYRSISKERLIHLRVEPKHLRIRGTVSILGYFLKELNLHACIKLSPVLETVI
jgi:hypothetical protein